MFSALLLLSLLLEWQISSLHTSQENLKGLLIAYNNSKSLMPSGPDSDKPNQCRLQPNIKEGFMPLVYWQIGMG